MRYNVEKDKTEAKRLYALAMAMVKAMPAGLDIAEKRSQNQEVCDLLTLACNLCPHDMAFHRPDLDTDTIEVWECPDCSNHNYVRKN
jgi:hypothetical protein